MFADRWAAMVASSKHAAATPDWSPAASESAETLLVQLLGLVVLVEQQVDPPELVDQPRAPGPSSGVKVSARSKQAIASRKALT